MGVCDSGKIDRLCFAVTALQSDLEPRKPEKNFYIIYIIIYNNIELDFDFCIVHFLTVTIVTP